MGRLCYPTQHPVTILILQPQSCHGARRVWRSFCRPGTNFIEHYACRDTSLTGARKLSLCRIFFKSTRAVSRYKFDQSQKTVTVQDFYYGQMSVSGSKNHYPFVQSAGVEAKTVTSNLPILSVLGYVIFTKYIFLFSFVEQCT